MADVFVSYAREDRALAERVVRAIESSGYSVWWDDRITPTESFDRLIEQEIADARAVVVLWSANSVQSDWVRIEANYGKKIASLFSSGWTELRRRFHTALYRHGPLGLGCG